MNPEILEKVSCERLKHDLFYLCRDPLPFRTVMYTLPWHEKNSLDEADEFIAGEMKKYSSKVNMLPYKLRPLRCDSSKALHHWYSAPHDDDPWYDANCIEVIFPGTEKPEEIIQLVSHKDSMSWINSPGAHDNATGTVANMEIARILSTVTLKRTVRILFCNEEHTPWYSKTYAADSAARKDNIIAVFNNDSLCGKSDEAAASGIRSFVSAYSTPEGKELADFIISENKKYNIPMTASAVAKPGAVNDDDGSFILAGYLHTTINLGSLPYGDPQYHLRGDVPERVDITNLALSVRLLLASVLDIDAEGAAVFKKK